LEASLQESAGINVRGKSKVTAGRLSKISGIAERGQLAKKINAKSRHNKPTEGSGMSTFLSGLKSFGQTAFTALRPLGEQVLGEGLRAVTNITSDRIRRIEDRALGVTSTPAARRAVAAAFDAEDREDVDDGAPSLRELPPRMLSKDVENITKLKANIKEAEVGYLSHYGGLLGIKDSTLLHEQSRLRPIDAGKRAHPSDMAVLADTTPIARTMLMRQQNDEAKTMNVDVHVSNPSTGKIAEKFVSVHPEHVRKTNIDDMMDSYQSEIDHAPIDIGHGEGHTSLRTLRKFAKRVPEAAERSDPGLLGLSGPQWAAMPDFHYERMSDLVDSSDIIRPFIDGGPEFSQRYIRDRPVGYPAHLPGTFLTTNLYPNGLWAYDIVEIPNMWVVTPEARVHGQWRANVFELFCIRTYKGVVTAPADVNIIGRVACRPGEWVRLHVPIQSDDVICILGPAVGLSGLYYIPEIRYRAYQIDPFAAIPPVEPEMPMIDRIGEVVFARDSIGLSEQFRYMVQWLFKNMRYNHFSTETRHQIELYSSRIQEEMVGHFDGANQNIFTILPNIFHADMWDGPPSAQARMCVAKLLNILHLQVGNPVAFPIVDEERYVSSGYRYLGSVAADTVDTEGVFRHADSDAYEHNKYRFDATTPRLALDPNRRL
jgi:hypothetical protein